MSNPPNIFASFGSSSTPASSNSNAFDTSASAPSTSVNNQPAKPPPAFGQTSGFGATSTTAASSPSLFGNSFANLASNTGGQSGGLFGAAKNNTTSSPALGSAPISSGTNLFGGGQSASSFAASAKSPFSSLPGGSLFGSGTPASSTTATGETPVGLFGTKPATTPADATASASDKQPVNAPTPSLFGNPSSASTSAPKPAFPPSSLFSNVQKKNEGEPQSFTSSPFTSLTPKPTLGEAVKDNKTSDKADSDAAKTGSKPGLLAVAPQESSKDSSLTKPPEQTTSAPSASAAFGSTATAPTSTTVPAPSMLRGKTVEDIVNRWTTDLETQARAFSQFASEVAVWDRALIENGNYISALYATVIQAESTQTSLDQTLDHVEQQQRQLISTLDQYEKTASEILSGSGGVMASTEGLGLADSERDKSYALAANLYTQLDDLSHSLTQMVDAVNGLNISPAPKAALGEDSNEDPISTIAGILNAHLSSLQWIDSYLRDMESKVKDAERKIGEVVNRRGSDGFAKVRSFGLSSSRR